MTVESKMSEANSEYLSVPYDMKSKLRQVDLNLLTVFDAVMQEQNITRAARNLGMSQPAVSNAVARLKVLFNDDLFSRYGRGIKPTARAYQLFGSVHQALQLIQNELPGSGFDPLKSERIFHICICSPLDTYLTSTIYNRIEKEAPNIHLVFSSALDKNIEHQLRYDEMVLVASKNHPRIHAPLKESDIYIEEHAVVSLERYASFSQPWYDTPDKQSRIAYQGMALVSVLNVVSQTHLVCIAPRWLSEKFADSLELQIMPLPLKRNSRTCFLSWHEAAGRDKGHQWMEELLIDVCRRV